MNEETKAALEASIEKWKLNAVAVNRDDYGVHVQDCPLCRVFWYKDCKGCPVSTKTGQGQCHGTPYGNAKFSHNPEKWKLDGGASARKAALDEVAFLESLRV